MRLYSINYFGIKQECLDLNFELNDLVEPDLGTNRKILLSLVQINFIFKYLRKLLWAEIVKIGFVLLEVILSSFTIHYFRNNVKIYNLLMDNKCYDDFSHVSFKLGYNSINSCLKYLAINLAFSIADLVFKIVMFVIFLIKKKDEKIN